MANQLKDVEDGHDLQDPDQVNLEKGQCQLEDNRTTALHVIISYVLLCIPRFTCS